MCNKIKGVSFNVSSLKSNHILRDIFKCIDVNGYIWYIIKSQSEIWDELYSYELFYKTKYYGGEFTQLINNSHCINFLKLQAYSEDNIFVNIHTYDEFEKSECQIMVLIYDCEFVEIYAKEFCLVKRMFEGINLLGAKNVDYITDINDTRYKMDVI